MRPVNEIIVHCTATPEGRAVTVSEIDRWHRQRGWSGIGYHRVIGLNGERWQGRALEKIGAHCEGHNSGTIGVAYAAQLAEMEAENAALPDGGACGLGRDRVRLLNKP